MSELTAARLTMAISLGFHIILAAIGMVMPFLMASAHRVWLRTGRPEAYALTRKWMRGVAIFFAVGAVSGTALSFELGLLWPTFMLHAGPIIGMPFSLEGAAFFVEAIAFGIYLYGWERLPPRLHWWSGIVVGLAGLASGILVVSANGWMNAPSGFRWVDGAAVDIDPIAALFNAAWFSQASHMALASIEAVGFAVAAIHAALWLQHREAKVHRLALQIALPFAAIAALLQPLNGHMAAQDVAQRQPAKLAAMEAHFETSSHAPLWLLGIPDVDTEQVHWGVELPSLLSILAFDDPAAEVTGLKAFPKALWPPVPIVHGAFQVMVGLGSWLAALGALGLLVLTLKKSWLDQRWFLRLLLWSGPLGFVAMEAGWVVTEVGRQPWIIYGILKTEDAVTPVPGQWLHLLAFAGLYGLLGLCTVWMWRRQLQHGGKDEVPPASLLRWAKIPLS